MAYATYGYYVSEFGGNAVPEPLFARCMNLAGRYIDRYTFGRIPQDDAGSIDGLSDCACEMAEAIYNARFKEEYGKVKKSESIDGYSVSYVTEQKDGEDVNAFLEKKLYGICFLYLSDTGLLYRGIGRC